MKLSNLMLSLTCLCLTSLSFAAELQIPNTVELMAVNGQKIPDTKLLTVPAGKNQLVFRYEEALRDGTHKKKFQSSPLIVTVQISDANSHLVLHHTQFRDYSAADSAFSNQKVVWKIENEQGEMTDIQPEILPGNPGLFPYQNIEAAIQRYRMQNHTSATNMNVSVNTSAKEHLSQPMMTPAATPSMPSAASDTFVPQIQSWYLHASDAQRKALLKWMIEQQ